VTIVVFVSQFDFYKEFDVDLNSIFSPRYSELNIYPHTRRSRRDRTCGV